MRGTRRALGLKEQEAEHGLPRFEVGWGRNKNEKFQEEESRAQVVRKYIANVFLMD